MANTITAFLETLAGEVGDYNAATVGKLAAVDFFYKDLKSEIGRMGQTVNVYFPDLPAATDIGNGPFADSNLNPSFVPVVFNHRPAISFTVNDFEQWQTAVAIREKFIDPAWKRCAEVLNAAITAVLTTGNFNVNPTVQSTVGGEVTVTAAGQAWDNLATQKVPLSPETVGLLTHNNVYRNMFSDTQWTQESLVGVEIAQVARRQANLGVAFNAQTMWDQQMPKTSAAVAGTVALTNNSAAVVGTTTTFTGLTTFTNLIFSSDPTQRQYQILSIADDTHLTLATPYAGATASGGSATNTSYACFYGSKYAVGIGLRPLPPPDERVVEYQPLMIRGVPMRLMIGYQQRGAGYLVTLDFGYGIAVLRPAFGNIIKC